MKTQRGCCDTSNHKITVLNFGEQQFYEEEKTKYILLKT